MLLIEDPLPAAKNGVAEENWAAPKSKRRGTLLIVDDEAGPRQALRVVFKDEYDLLMAEDEPTAIKLAQENDIDVAVLDIRLGGGVSGIDVLERLKFVKPDMQAIMLTAFETNDTIRNALRLGACDYLNKPFDLPTMRAAVGKAMQRRTLESEISSGAEKIQGLLTELQNQRVAEKIAKERGEIYAHIFHDINGPLTTISGFVQLLNQRLNRATRLEVEDLEFVKHQLNIVTRQTTSCIEISRRYLDSMRNKSGQGAPRISVSQLLKDLEPLLHAHPAAHQNDFSLTAFGADVGVKANATEVIQILRNLAVNALQCTPEPHRVEIGGEVLRQPLDLMVFKDGPNDRILNVESLDNTAPLVKFFVRDTGPGIPAEVLPKIFQEYFTTKGPREGTGLGLNIVQRFIKEGRGALHCHTKPGEGTTFTVYLPGAELAK